MYLRYLYTILNIRIWIEYLFTALHQLHVCDCVCICLYNRCHFHQMVHITGRHNPPSRTGRLRIIWTAGMGFGRGCILISLISHSPHCCKHRTSTGDGLLTWVLCGHKLCVCVCVYVVSIARVHRLLFYSVYYPRVYSFIPVQHIYSPLSFCLHARAQSSVPDILSTYV